MTTLPRLAIAGAAILLCLSAGCACESCKKAMTRTAATSEPEVTEEYWPNGNLRIRREVIRAADGTLVNHGNYQRWYPDGQEEYEAVFVNGKKHGTTTLWHKNGRKWTEEQYVNGLKHGTRRIWDEEGVLRKEEQYADGKPHGTWTLWDKSGNIKWRTSFDHGRPQPQRAHRG